MLSGILCTKKTRIKGDGFVELELRWWEKPAYRLPEAAWLSFVPLAPDPSGWRLDKMGAEVDPRRVVAGGNRRMHGITRGIRYRDGEGSLAIDSLDAPLVSAGKRSLLDFDDVLPDLAGGMHFCLHDNVWGTNFRMWFEDDMRFRFRLRAT